MAKSRFFSVGNVNLRGKKTLNRGCGCCSVYDFREYYETRRVINEEMLPATISDAYEEQNIRE